jgi:predicted ATPase
LTTADGYAISRDRVFGMGSGPIPDRFLVGLAVLNLLSDAAEQQPLICVADDEQWLDGASAQVLGFVSRRSVAESIGTMNGFCLAAETLPIS